MEKKLKINDNNFFFASCISKSKKENIRVNLDKPNKIIKKFQIFCC